MDGFLRPIPQTRRASPMPHDRTPFPRPSDRLTPGELPGRERLPIYGLLDNIRGIGNVGSMFRTADAANLGGLYLCGMTGTPPRPDMEKTALGATATVPWDYWRRPEAAVAELRDRGVAVHLFGTQGARACSAPRFHTHEMP